MHKLYQATLVISLFLSCKSLNAQQIPDTLYSPPEFEPLFKDGKGTLVYVDEAHYNFHTATGGYRAFCKLLRKDGFRTAGWNQKFELKSLDSIRILVIANALHESNSQNWDPPNPSAFSADEIMALNEWVKKGGSLFLIADHMPFAGSATDLASSFGFKFYNSFALDLEHKSSGDLFTRKDGGLPDIMTPDSIVSFTGQAFEIPKEARSLIKLDKRFSVLLPEKTWVFNKDTKQIPGEGLSQLAIMEYGKGKIVISGEAAMFTAQLNNKKPVGMNSKKAPNNYRLLLNLVYWLNEK